jgi:hypothetical protein
MTTTGGSEREGVDGRGDTAGIAVDMVGAVADVIAFVVPARDAGLFPGSISPVTRWSAGRIPRCLTAPRVDEESTNLLEEPRGFLSRPL